MTDDELPADVREALDVAVGIADAIEDVPEWKRNRNAGFFDSVGRKAEKIAESIRHQGAVTLGQRQALDNMLAGVRKWLGDDD